MKLYNYGNNIVKNIDLKPSGKINFSTGPYDYFFYNSLETEIISIENLKSYSIYVLKKSLRSSITIFDKSKEVSEGSVIQVENEKIKINVEGGKCSLLIAGTSSKHPETKGVFVTEHNKIYKVTKPWGHELWINGNHPNYALKQIFIKSNNKTSLQYHNFKKETNVLFEGDAFLHYQKNINTVKYSNAKLTDIEQVYLKPVSTIDVKPLTIHRIESCSDILLYEASTPHLEDVIRIFDDTNRMDGFIAEEHNSK